MRLLGYVGNVEAVFSHIRRIAVLDDRYEFRWEPRRNDTTIRRGYEEFLAHLGYPNDLGRIRIRVYDQPTTSGHRHSFRFAFRWRGRRYPGTA